MLIPPVLFHFSIFYSEYNMTYRQDKGLDKTDFQINISIISPCCEDSLEAPSEYMFSWNNNTELKCPNRTGRNLSVLNN